jgi:hypothetical protein
MYATITSHTARRYTRQLVYRPTAWALLLRRDRSRTVAVTRRPSRAHRWQIARTLCRGGNPMCRRSTALFVALFMGWIGSSAFAGSHIRDFLNGPPVSIRGQYLGTSVHGVDPFVVQVYADLGECLRLEVTSSFSN